MEEGNSNLREGVFFRYIPKKTFRTTCPCTR